MADRMIIKRWIKIGLRTLHLLSVAGVGGGILFGIDPSLWNNYWRLALISGVLMMLVDIVSNPVWLLQIRGLAIYVKLLLLVAIGHFPSLDAAILLVIIIISGIISHAPGSLRYYSIYHGRSIYSDSNTKG